MTAQKNLDEIAKVLQKHKQGHLLAFWAQLDDADRQSLLEKIQKLDFSQIEQWVANLVKSSVPAALPKDLVPAPFYPSEPTNTEQEQKYARAREFGRELISSGKVAAFVVAGGQGTRLGFDGPKGNFPISPVKNKTLFQIFAETIAAVSQKNHSICPWYIMTSPINHSEITEIFRTNNYYGLDEKDVFIFEQGTLPNFGFDGKILLADKADIACSPDGHGGSLKALYNSGALEDMKKRGVEYISYFQVDNPLINIFDPLFVGLHALDKSQMSSKTLVKTGPKEKVGVFCLTGARVRVIEYSDLPDELAQKRNPDGSLVFGLGSIAIHIISVTFVEELKEGGFNLPLHKAVKKIPYINHQGLQIQPTEPNGVKLEHFVFDALPMASKSIILQTRRNEEFAPVKNEIGTDSPQTAKKMMVQRAADWLESAGINVPRKDDGRPDCLIEIAPSFALEEEDVKAKLERIPQIKPGDKLYLA